MSSSRSLNTPKVNPTAPTVPQGLFIPIEIVEIVIQYLSQLIKTELDETQTATRSERQLVWYKRLVPLKAICRTFRVAVDSLVYSTIEIDTISIESLELMKRFVKSPSICSAVRVYHFHPQMSFPSRDQPILFHSQAARSSHIHSKTERIIYDEETKLMQFRKAQYKWCITGLAYIFLSINKPPPTSSLKILPWFTGVQKFIHLQELKIEYSDNIQGVGNVRHTMIRNDISAGLACLLTSLKQLQSLHMGGPTMADIQVLIYFIYKTRRTRSITIITFLNIALRADNAGLRGFSLYPPKSYLFPFRKDSQEKWQALCSTGKPISDLIDLFPKLKALDVSYHRVTKRRIPAI